MKKQRPKAPTIHDVAAHAGVSRSTVSRVLNDPHGAPSATRSAVERAVRELRYQPSQAARSLRSGRSNTVALIVGDIRQPYFASMARALSHAARDSGRGLILFDVERDLEILTSVLDDLRSLPLSGIIIAIGRDIDTARIRKELEQFTKDGVHVVTATQHLEYTSIPSVTVDHAESAYRAVRHLRSRGRERIALVSGPSDAPHITKIVRGYRAALAEDKDATEDPSSPALTVSDDLIISGSFRSDAVRAEVKPLLAKSRPPDAFITTTTFDTMGIMSALEDAGMIDDVDVVCLERTDVLDHVRPKVATFGVDYDDYAGAILGALDDDGRRPSSVVIRTQLREI